MNEPVILQELGKVWGRDAIFLDKIDFIDTSTVRLLGEFNGSLCEKLVDKTWVPYELIFSGILEFKLIELDFFSAKDYTASFEKVVDSPRIKAFSQHSENFKVKEGHTHYIFHTYDDVIEVIASEFQLKLLESKTVSNS